MVVTEIQPTKKNDEKIKLAAYCRVSTDSLDQRNSFLSQIKYYSDYVKMNPQYKLVDIYADEGITGTSIKKRDEMKRLIRDCEKGKIDVVITKSVSRFARNTNDLLVTIRLLKELGVRVFFEEQGLDTDKMNLEMLLTFPGLAAQQESQSISQNLRWSYQKRMQSGEFNCCLSPFGYYMKDGNLVINPEEAEIIKSIFNMYLDGYGKQTIANILNKENDSPKKWSYSSIDYILNNEKYVGNALLQKRYTTDVLPYRRVKNSGEMPMYYVENSNPPIISKEIYDKVKELQKSRKVDSYKRPNHILTGMLVCNDCGKRFRRIVQDDKVLWVCSYKSSKRSNCNTGNIPETAVFEAFTAMIFKLKQYEDYLLEPLIKQIDKLLEKTSNNHEEISFINKQIADYSTKNLFIAKLHTKGILSQEEYCSQSSDINDKITTLKRKYKKLVNGDESTEKHDSLKRLIDIIDSYKYDGAFNEDLFHEVVKQITVIGQNQLRFKIIGDLELTETIERKGRVSL
ncbi:recombinase family protein [Ruminococcus sp.]|uniref:recombinase family protein n=1 Tax=Ruminococcus sp. TaxID=41978 RepID=UPI003EFE6CC1